MSVSKISKTNPLKELKSTLGAGARTNRFKIIIPAPKDLNFNSKEITTLVRSTSLPTKSFADIEFFIHGKKVSVAGDVEFSDTITFSFIDTEDHKIRTLFDNWMIYIDSFKNVRKAKSFRDYMTTIKIQQLSTKDNSVTKEYKLFYAYPKELGAVNFDQTNQELITFDVTFKFTHWE